MFNAETHFPAGMTELYASQRAERTVRAWLAGLPTFLTDELFDNMHFVFNINPGKYPGGHEYIKDANLAVAFKNAQVLYGNRMSSSLHEEFGRLAIQIAELTAGSKDKVGQQRLVNFVSRPVRYPGMCQMKRAA